MITLRTDRLTLRPLRLSDAEALHPAFADESAMHWWSSAPHSDLARTRDYVAGNVDSPDYPTWAITRNDDVAIGWVVLPPRRDGVAEIGYILRREHWGAGIAREAVTAVIDHGFDALGLRRIYADTDPENGASIGLLRSLGFTLEGRLRGEWETHIGVRDSLIWGLLRNEWSKAAARASR